MRGATFIDTHVGARLRLRRSILDMSQSELGDQLGVSFQQIQKYERGTNRLGASRLFSAARVLQVEVGYFFEGLNETPIGSPADSINETVYEFIASADGLELAKAFSSISRRGVRRRLIELIRALA